MRNYPGPELIQLQCLAARAKGLEALEVRFPLSSYSAKAKKGSCGEICHVSVRSSYPHTEPGKLTVLDIFQQISPGTCLYHF